jgi:uncharacterized protein YbjT (DUF2867 family)
MPRLQNIVTYDGATIRSDRAFYAARGESKISLIDVRDVGDVVAKLLGTPQPHAGQTYELNGPEAGSNAEIAERISRVAGTKVSYIDIPEDAHRQAMLAAGMPEWQVSAILGLQDYYRSGACATVDGTTARLLGHPERTLDAYLTENAASFRSQAA